MKLELSIRYNIEMLGKKSESPAGIKPKTAPDASRML